VSAPPHLPRRRIPEATVLRLPVYQRILAEQVRNNVSTVSSEQLAALAAVNAAKVRKDLSLLGSFGTRGSGYDPNFLIAEIDRALGLDKQWPIAIVGIGNLGRALTNSQGFAARGFRVTALFDIDPAVIGEEIAGLGVRHMGEIASMRSTERPAIGVITTPGEAAQEVADLLVQVGVTSLLNFAPRVLTVPAHVYLRYVDLSIELQVLGFYRSRQDDLAHAAADGEDEESDRLPLIRSVGLSAPADLD
jgi:redox-sensing transcriptional repressor